jgi:hypothetical protein
VVYEITTEVSIFTISKIAMMSRNYKFHNPDGLYFISFAVVGWLDACLPQEGSIIYQSNSR